MFLKLNLILFFLASLILVKSLSAQNFEGVTGIRDTSYTNTSAFAKDIKKHPNIKLVSEFRFKSVSEIRDIVYDTTANRNLKLDVFQNNENLEIPKTAIILIHGGGWRSGNKRQHIPLAQKLASLGYVCFTPEYRLSTEALFPAAVHDLKTVIRWIRTNSIKYNIDSEKIVVSGFSAGGELAAFLGTTPNMPLFECHNYVDKVSSHTNAMIVIDGILSFVHPQSGEGDDSKKTSAATYWFGYSKKENPILWEAASPLNYVGKHTPPTLFINSAVDRMHAGREDFIKVLNEYSIFSKVIEYKTAPHSFVLYKPWFDPLVKEIDNFLKFVLE